MSSIDTNSTTNFTDTGETTVESKVLPDGLIEAAGELVVAYFTDPTDETDGSSGGSVEGEGDGADSNGLTFPFFNIDLKETMLVLAAMQSETTEESAEFTSDQIEAMLADKFELAAENVAKAAKARAKAKTAEFWSKVAQYAGYAAIGLTLIAAVATANPVLLVAGIAMACTTAMNETGATEDLINTVGGGNTVLGTIIVGAAIVALSVASGGVAGLTLFTTLTPALLVTAENLENMGVDSEAAMWIAVGAGVAFALLGAFAASRMASSAANATSKTSGLADDGARLAEEGADMGTDAMKLSDDLADTGDDALRIGDDLVDSGDDAAGLGDDLANSSDEAALLAEGTADGVTDAYQSSRTTLNSMMKAAERSGKTAEDSTTFAAKLKTVMRKATDGRLERLLQKGMPKFFGRTNDLDAAAEISRTVVRINQATTGAEAVLDLFITGAQVAIAFAEKSGEELSADADLIAAQGEFVSQQQEIYEQRLSNFAESFNSILSNTCDALDTYHAATARHTGYSI